MSLSQSLVVLFFKSLTSLLAHIDDAELARVPHHGPLIIYTNHVNLLEIPIIYTHLQPRRVHGMLLAERWKIPVINWALDVSETIPLHRGEADILAIKQALDLLKMGETLVIAPEGTRSHDGRLASAHPGVVLLALHSHASLIPVAYFGAENWKENLRRLRRVDFHLRVGRPFHLDQRGQRVTGTVRQQMVDEMMYQLAELLPERYRGVYSDQTRASTRYLVFEG
ncbi:MAG TPA: lysophospholipid acyltransferase family protein [Anaerolineales bacterium]